MSRAPGVQGPGDPEDRAGDGPADDPPAPVAFGKYRIHRRIARGGMGEVFLASLVGELGFEKRLVIKTILPEHAAKPRFIELFAAEAKTAVALSHGNIVPIYELGRAEDTFYIVMGHVDGPSLDRILVAQRATGDSMPLPITLGIVRDILTGLAYAHSDEPGRPAVVHRDITPRNVLVDRSGQVRLVDFGIAMPANVAVDMRAGSTGYVAPEQARAELTDPRADVFSVGCILYELCTLRRAFPREGVWSPPDFDDVPQAVRPVLEAALAIAPADRPAHAGAMLTALAPVVATHAGTLTAGDISAYLRRLFPEGWEPTPTQSMAADITPVTRLLPQTYATRLTSVTPVQPTKPSPAEMSSASLTGASQVDLHPAAAPSRLRRALPVAALVVAAVALTWAFMRPPDPSSDRPVPPVASPPVAERAPEPVREPEAPILHATQTAGEVASGSDDDETGDASGRAEPVAQLVHRLTVEPADAEVRVDDTVLPGPGPYAIELHADGPRRVEVRRRGFASRTLELGPDAGESSTVALEATAPRGKGSLQVVALGVPWAEVTIDGKRHGSTPTKKIELPEGRHRVVVRCVPDACPQTRTLYSGSVTIEAGQSKKITAD
jgi:serine/threonine protein kinase